MHRIICILVLQSQGEKKTRRKLTKILIVPFRDICTYIDDVILFFFLFFSKFYIEKLVAFIKISKHKFFLQDQHKFN